VLILPYCTCYRHSCCFLLLLKVLRLCWDFYPHPCSYHCFCSCLGYVFERFGCSRGGFLWVRWGKIPHTFQRFCFWWSWVRRAFRSFKLFVFC
jgi:hypothetical protein